MLSADDIKAINNAAFYLNIPFQWLYKEIAFETAGTFSPTIKNPYSSARGLLQFTDESARELNFESSMDLVTQLPDIPSQIAGAVVPYLQKRGPFPTQQALAMAVFYPAYMHVSPDTVFSAEVQSSNPGIVQVSDYINKVNEIANYPIVANSIVLLILSVASIALIHYFKTRT
jgi:hypothetical protein